MDLQQKRHGFEYQVLLNNIPGGVMQCLNDEYYTMLEVNQGFLDMFGFREEELKELFEERFINMIHPADCGTVREEVDAQLGRGDKVVLNYRVLCKDGSYKWVMDNGQLIHEEQEEERIFSVITGFDKEKRMIDDLKRRAERDALTGLFNRAETERQICEHLKEKPEEICALFMIDTDNFKHVNDSQGHLFGDAVLSELAAGMKRLTRQTDVVGRIGGDEFTVFLKNIPSKEIAVDKAEKFISMFHQLFQNEKNPMEVTCSVGVAIYPEDGMDFQSLYHCADIALYQAKNQGKNRYVLFDTGNKVQAEPAAYSSLGAVIDSDQRTSGVPGDLVNYVFQILYDTSDIDRSIQLILEIVGKRFDVSRAYIFENSDDGKYTDNTYEWCNDGIAPQQENLQHFSYDDVDSYENLFRNNSLFYCRDIHSLTPSQAALFEGQGIYSTLQCAIREADKFKGFVGFDECTGMKMWTKEEIAMLSLISQLLSTFLQKKRIMDRDHQMAIQLNTILDVQDAYIYAVSQDSLELLYLNHKTRELDPNAETGMTCYKAFFGSNKPCRNCPLSGENNEIYNPRYDVWSRVKVKAMKWGDRNVYLLSCYDISEYKRMQERQ